MKTKLEPKKLNLKVTLVKVDNNLHAQNFVLTKVTLHIIINEQNMLYGYAQ